MSDETVYKIALAGYLHDIGKFAERASGEREQTDVLTTGFFPDEGFLNSNRDLYQPHHNGKYTHAHAVYTAAFLDHLESLLPKRLNKGEWGLGDSFVNLAAGHHKPQTPFQWIIAVADRVSSGFDRKEFEDSYNKGIDVRDYKKTRLLTIFEGLSKDGKWKEDSLAAYQYRYPLRELSPESIFPLDSPGIRGADSEGASRDYRELFFNFVSALEKISHKDNIPLWFEHFDSLFMIHASHIPAATVGNVVPDVSLYDHSKATAALSAALYRYHEETDTINAEGITDYGKKKFLIINGDFYGIQDFIFTEGGSTGRASAKLLRGRSFYVSLLSELAADMLCRELSLPVSSIILNAAGKFTIVSHNTEKAKSALRVVEEKVNDWLVENFHGQASMGFSFVEASCNDFVSKNFSGLWDNVSRESEKRKCSKIDLNRHGGNVKSYLDSFNNQLGICPFCSKRPAEESSKVKGQPACRICRDQIHIGENLVKKDQIAITTADADLDAKLLEPLFGEYQFAFARGEMNDLARRGKLLKFWSIGIAEEDGNVARNITAKFLNGYVPQYREEDNYDERLLHGRKSDEAKLELIEMITEGAPKTFGHIAKIALNEYETSGKYRGVEAIGVLKADVDNLGLLFACGVREERQSLSRIATMSRQLNNYFSLFLPYKLQRDFKDVYTVFAGGDDLFLIGPWNKIIELAGVLSSTFREYVCKNADITLSAGISVHKPGVPVMTIAGSSEHALGQSKSGGKNRVTIFGETAEWAEFEELEKIKDTIENWLDTGMINSAMVFRLNELIEMRRQEDEITRAGNVSLEDMECLKWRSRLKYTIVRNIGKNLKGEEKARAIGEAEKMVEWLQTYGGALKIPLWQIIYNRR